MAGARRAAKRNQQCCQAQPTPAAHRKAQNQCNCRSPASAPPPSSMGGGEPGAAAATRKGEGRPLSVRAGEACGTAGQGRGVGGRYSWEGRAALSAAEVCSWFAAVCRVHIQCSGLAWCSLPCRHDASDWQTHARMAVLCDAMESHWVSQSAGRARRGRGRSWAREAPHTGQTGSCLWL